jgi:uncharacterized protein (DUF1330 family)
MPAYVIAEVSVTDPARYEEYKKLVVPTLAAYDGKFVVRGGKSETLEGDWKPERLVILEFPSFARARQWWSSSEYAPALKLRQQSARTNMILIEGA